MNEADYKAFYDKVGRLNGWDFSKIKSYSEGVGWDFFREVSLRCGTSDLLLDIGTGGGEALLSIADDALLLVGIDDSAGMIRTANENLLKSNKQNVRCLQMNADRLDFPANFFNVVSCRHSPFSANEAARVLSNKGLFLTQQVSEADKFNIKQAFGRGQQLGVKDGTLKKQCMEELMEAGFGDIQTFEYDAAEYYETPADFILLLKHTPIIPDFGLQDDDFVILHKFIADNMTNKGIKTNTKRFMLIARK